MKGFFCLISAVCAHNAKQSTKMILTNDCGVNEGFNEGHGDPQEPCHHFPPLLAS